MSLDMTDLFCGAGGSTTGAAQVPGVTVKIAANHWQLACDVHNANHPGTDHAAVDLHQEDPRYFPRTRLLWASPECTKWSQASGKKRPAIEEGLFADPNADDAATRSRLLMFDVLRFAEYHRYDMMIIENVVDIAVSAKYTLAWAEWRRQLTNLGYKHRTVSLNSMHAQAFGPPAPQSRDRIYIVCWRNDIPTPDLESILRPQAWCPRCERFIEAQQSWKPGRTVGKYRQQYVYVHGACGATVEPGWLPASAAIDWTIPGQMIGERPKSLADKTRRRIAAGIARYWLDPFLAEVAGHTYERHPGVRTRPVNDPMGTMTTTLTTGLLIPVEGRDGKDARGTWLPHRTQTTRNETGIACHPFRTQFRDRVRDLDPTADPFPTVVADGASHGLAGWQQPFIAELRGGGSDARTVSEPLATFAANGTHHGLVVPYYSGSEAGYPTTDPLGTVSTRDHHALLMRNNTGGAEMSTPVHEVMRTITTAAHQSLIHHPGPRPAREHVSEDAMRAAERMVDECYFRMLTPLEAARAQAFPDSYRWDTAEAKKISNRDLVKLAGNAVTPPTSRDLLHVVVQTLELAA